ncbi:SpoIIE family protein phosphatase [Streptomyces sp. NBC_01304]|uniref:SpoIIE family protein phosphatase n=1 Tax=Streptomyces sp. NBC_01304 TaxID=2903818 RepID=UPI002E111E68|nr:SpoIIE family protein phosphatase [Streptomyces sp. NBC_01304]
MSDDAPPYRLFAAEPDGRLGDEYRLLRQILDGTQAGISVMDTELRYRFVNRRMAQMNGIPAEDHVGRTLKELLPHVHRNDDVLRRVLRDGRPRELNGVGRTLAKTPYDMREWHVSYHRLELDGETVGIAGVGLENSAARAYLRSLEQAHERLALYDRAAVRTASSLDPKVISAELADTVVPTFADAASVELFVDDQPTGQRPPPLGTLRLRRAALTAVPHLEGLVGAFGVPGDTIDYQQSSAIRRALETGLPWLDNDISEEAYLRVAPTPDPARLSAYRAARLHSGLVLPLPGPGHPLGTLTMIRAGDSPPFTEQDVLIAGELATRAAANLDHAKRYAQEYAMAQELQRALLSEPSFAHPDLEVASRYLPAGDNAVVGGDWFDAIALPGGRSLLVIGDVMGHGVQAAVAMSHYRSMLRLLAASGMPPDEILQEADQRVSRLGFDRSATCLLLRVDPREGSCTSSSAGHLPALRLLPDGRTELLSVSTGPPLGTGVGGYGQHLGKLVPGAAVLMFSDGLIERRGEAIDDSLRRLTSLRLRAGAPLEDILDKVLAGLSPVCPDDDITLLAARLRA